MISLYDNERAGLPSASGGLRAALCPGSLRMENAVRVMYPELAEWSSPEAIEGERLHAITVGDLPDSELEPDQEWVVERARKLELRAMNWAGISDKAKATHEQRLWLHDWNTFQPLTSGRYDRLYIEKLYSLLIDYKFGWVGPGSASENMQLLFNAAILYQKLGIHPIFAALIQPRLPEEEALTMVIYDEATLKKAVNKVTRVCLKALKPDAPIIPGPKQCDWCNAKAFCPKAIGIVEAFAGLRNHKAA